MKKILFLAALIGFSYTSQAQVLKKIQRKLEDKAEKTVDNVLDKKQPKSETNSGSVNTSGAIDILTTSEPFLGGTQLIFSDDLRNDAVGSMPRYWQTNSTGSVVEISGAAGKWLNLAPQASYQLDTLLQLPSKFTLEFDLLTRASEAKDLRKIEFGFSKNNSTKKFIYGVSKEVSIYQALQYYYGNISTNAGSHSSRLPFPLSNYANAVMHVSMSVDGERLQVYIDQQKVLDAAVIDVNAPKHFFVSTETYRNNAKAFISNLKIAGF